MLIKEFCYDLGLLWEKNCSQLRFGQLIENIRTKNGDLFYLNNEEMMDIIREYCEEASSRKS